MVGAAAPEGACVVVVDVDELPEVVGVVVFVPPELVPPLVPEPLLTGVTQLGGVPVWPLGHVGVATGTAVKLTAAPALEGFVNVPEASAFAPLKVILAEPLLTSALKVILSINASLLTPAPKSPRANTTDPLLVVFCSSVENAEPPVFTETSCNLLESNPTVP
jgi:hypothetical protein